MKIKIDRSPFFWTISKKKNRICHFIFGKHCVNNDNVYIKKIKIFPIMKWEISRKKNIYIKLNLIVLNPVYISIKAKATFHLYDERSSSFQRFIKPRSFLFPNVSASCKSSFYTRLSPSHRIHINYSTRIPPSFQGKI